MRGMSWLVCMALLLGHLCGCSSRDQSGDASPMHDYYAESNAAILHQLHVSAVDRAIISQHTIYPYHFHPDAARLNDLGNESIHVLANHHASVPGRINVARGDAGELLYQSRVQHVIDRLVALGVAGSDIEVVDETPGGEGRSSEEVILVRSRLMGSQGTSESGGN